MAAVGDEIGVAKVDKNVLRTTVTMIRRTSFEVLFPKTFELFGA